MAQLIDGCHHLRTITARQRINEAEHMAAVNRAQHLAHTRFLKLAAGKGDGLVGQAERIAHRTTCCARQKTQRLRLGRNILVGQHAPQVLLHRLGCHGPQVELQTAREHGHRHLLRIGGRQHELQVLGRLLQRLQHSVEGGIGEHVHFVDHEDLEAPLHGFVDSLLQQALHFIHATVGSGVKLCVIRKATAVDLDAVRAHPARGCRDAARAIGPRAIERLGQNARDRRLTHPTRSREQIGMVQALLGEGIGQCLHHMLLAHHFSEIPWTVFAGENEIGHRQAFYGQSEAPLARHCFVQPTTGQTCPVITHQASFFGLSSQKTPFLSVQCIPDGPPRMGKRPTGSGGEPSSPNCGSSAGGKARHLSFQKLLALRSFGPSKGLFSPSQLQPSNTEQKHRWIANHAHHHHSARLAGRRRCHRADSWANL
ncbi:hypothetical protein D3C72_1169070 [compost metagenome]